MLTPFRSTFAIEEKNINEKTIVSLIDDIANENAKLMKLGLEGFDGKVKKKSNIDDLIKNIEAEKEKVTMTIDKLRKIENEKNISSADKSKLLELINIERYHIVSYEKLLEYLRNASIEDDYDLLYSFLLNGTMAKETLRFVNDIVNL
ncbi:Hypothetical protein CCH01_001300 [Clostridium chauvoei JF4335]|nr:Hypothetical protein CCH01_001300 [Clostridium chauvoei JF4335]